MVSTLNDTETSFLRLGDVYGWERRVWRAELGGRLGVFSVFVGDRRESLCFLMGFVAGEGGVGEGVVVTLVFRAVFWGSRPAPSTDASPPSP